ncbi:nuclear matrix protein [Purpureocillium lavendulum]|uniref:Nuclear matrix protein n=1 Tax=Purpureocillium lavendulum TaxID=1247861 RepID=A0AB34FZ39_9HYPO|nr:nuclear matrix protein [Purpureocillium lavendulum]
MPALDVGNPGVPAVVSVGRLLEDLLGEAATAKQTATIEPAVSPSDFNDLTSRVVAASTSDVETKESNGTQQVADKSRQFAVVETAARDLFDQLIAYTSIDSPDFVKMWNLLDILSILSDNGQCDPALMFWLVEELLDSQTIAGCRKVFDYLESRRDRITVNHFKQKQLVILRSCNELLRRLSRAEDTAFCGRVFIFLFQSFPLGDRSSVNLRGEYHVENVTRYETDDNEDETKMDVDSQGKDAKESTEPKSNAKGVSFGSSKDAVEPDALYPLFWSLQESFSQPLKLFEVAHFNKFKTSLDLTMKAFHAMTSGEGPTSLRASENMRRNLKRKKDEETEKVDDTPETFNPKYLTSRDLFELEISDLSFRRHVLVQALIITDFILSMSAGAKEKLANMVASNKSVMYGEQLNEENVCDYPPPEEEIVADEVQTKWATEMKMTISDYLKRGPDGPYFYRMVETVLARDKNWVFWKMASCPPIQREPVSDESFNESKGTAQRMATNKRLRQTPMGSVSMDFLRDDDRKLAMDNLQSAERYQLPDLDDLKRKIADDDFEISMPTNEQTKAAAIAGKASKSWRALRIAARTKLAAFDKIDDPNNIDVIFQDLDDEDDKDQGDEDAAREEDMPEDRGAIILCGLAGTGQSALVTRLMERHAGVFAPVVRHTTREPLDNEVKGKHFHFVTVQEFNQLRDGDRLLEYGTRDGTEYGTSTKALEAVMESGKVPIIELDLEATQFAKDMDFEARYVLDSPLSADGMRQRLANSGLDDAAVASVLAKQPAPPNGGQPGELFDAVIRDDEVESAVEALSTYVFKGASAEADTDTAAQRQGDEDTALVDSDANIVAKASSDAEAAVADDSGGKEKVDGARQPDEDTNMTDAQPDKTENGRHDSEGPSIVVKV